MDISITGYTVGAAVGGDLVGTSPTVRGDAGEALPDPGALMRFLSEHDVRLDAVADRRGPSADDVRDVQLLRREVRGILETETGDQAVAGGIVLLRRAGRSPVLRREDGGWQWYVPTEPGAPLAAELAALIAVGLLGTVRALGHERFRACAAPGCRGVFADTSRAGRRRYCMPGVCGNRLNVANHRARRRTGSAAR
ncbi:CGNR zinc finger domain-containing protein [Actinomadura graeca]|uniref:CGNR zinc finger domain-containing protein n=1 Tax=Actinomadura graeca TaxID=2750812 RepID=A0ABX8QZC3_9ACTN|nr:CGNR zinc finger domain-containing protein [Actinomadura graeca]QXJ23349.1 CGNR zinc finger domain-containing protein [Actinomadura graeca]